jgi:hypothetical protein
MSTRTENILKVTKRLILMTAGVLAVVVAFFGATLYLRAHFMVSWVCFGCGLLGGFVSIQQRLKKVSDAELALLSQSWFQIILIPVYGGLFALVLYVAFLSQIVTGEVFPRFWIPAFHAPPTTADVQAFFAETYPVSGADMAKLLFWSLVAGFSERFIPQIIAGAGDRGAGGEAEAPKVR